MLQVSQHACANPSTRSCILRVLSKARLAPRYTGMPLPVGSEGILSYHVNPWKQPADIFHAAVILWEGVWFKGEFQVDY